MNSRAIYLMLLVFFASLIPLHGAGLETTASFETVAATTKYKDGWLTYMNEGTIGSATLDLDQSYEQITLTLQARKPKDLNKPATNFGIYFSQTGNEEMLGAAIVPGAKMIRMQQKENIYQGTDLKKEMGLPWMGDGEYDVSLSLDMKTKTLSVKAGGLASTVELENTTLTGINQIVISSYKLGVDVRDMKVSGEAKTFEGRPEPPKKPGSAEKPERDFGPASAEEIAAWQEPTIEPIRMDGPLQPPLVTGATYYVAPDGDNANTGTEEKPWKTIQHGLDRLKAGERLFVREGTYKEKNLTFKNSGKPGHYITLSGYPGERAVIKGGGSLATFNLYRDNTGDSYLCIRNLYIDGEGNNNVFRVFGKDKHHIWIVNNDIQGSMRQPMIQINGPSHVVVSNNHVHSAGLAGILVNSGSPTNIVEWNIVHDVAWNADDEGAVKLMAPDCIARYNTIFNNQRSSTSKTPGWAPKEKGGKQWRHLQGVTGLYLDWAMVDPRNNPTPGKTAADLPTYAYGNRVFNNNGGIYAFRSDYAIILDNVSYRNGRGTIGAWVEGTPGTRWLDYGGPRGRGIMIGRSEAVKVFNNVSYDNGREGFFDFLPTGSVGTEVYNNVFYGNDGPEMNFNNDKALISGYNRVLQTEPNEAVVRFQNEDFKSFQALREKYPYMDTGSQTIQVKPAFAQMRRNDIDPRTTGFTEAEWEAAKARLIAAKPVQEGDKEVKREPFTHGGEQLALAWPLPGTIEAEHYDVGGPGVSYLDKDRPNQGGYLRQDQVDIKQNAQASGGALVGWGYTDEWLAYTVKVDRAGEYTFSVQYAAGETDGALRVTVDGKPVIDSLELASSGDWAKLQTVSTPVKLPAGEHDLRLIIIKGPVDIDRIGVE